MFVACVIWCLADVSSVSPSSEQTESRWAINPVHFFVNRQIDYKGGLVSGWALISWNVTVYRRGDSDPSLSNFLVLRAN